MFCIPVFVILDFILFHFVVRSGKKERPLNMATTDDMEDGSRTEVSPIVEDPDVYNFSHSRRGLALIIDNENFTSASRLPSRQGSDKDLTSLGDMFNRLGFEVEGYKDLKGEDMWKVLTEGTQNRKILEILYPSYMHDL